MTEGEDRDNDHRKINRKYSRFTGEPGRVSPARQDCLLFIGLSPGAAGQS